MTFIPGYERDVFISYAHDNNREQWVTKFKDRLENKLNEVLGPREHEKPYFWFDDSDLRTGDEVRGGIHNTLKRTATMVCVISPSYLSSGYCLRDELDYFINTRKDAVIIQAVKMPLRDNQKVPLADKKYVEFLVREGNNAVEEIDPSDTRFTALLNNVAKALASYLENMRRTRQAVFIAEPADQSLFEVAQQLRNELHAQGYDIPNERVVSITPEDRIREMIESSHLSVHFFSKEDDQLAKRQFEIARTIAKPMVLATLVPLDTTCFPSECGIPVLISGQSGLAGNWKQRLVEQICKRLNPLESHDELGTPLLIYVFCQSKGDLGDAQDLMDALREKGCEVLRPDFRIVDPANRQHDHEGKLGKADGVVLFGTDAITVYGTIDPARYVVAECPAKSSSQKGIYYISESLAELDGFLDAVASRHQSTASAGR